MEQSRLFKFALLLLVSTLVATRARAVNGPWAMNPVDGDWNAPSNWSSLTVPDGPTDIASFGPSSITNLFVSANTQVDSIVFNAGASAYTISVGRFRALTISGAGSSTTPVSRSP
jgi:hypothetical protein